MSAAAIPRLTVEQYVEIDDRSETKSEFHDGRLFPLAGNTFAHDLIATRIAVVLVPKLRGTQCTAATNTRVALPGFRPSEFCRPDLAVACRAALTGDRAQALINPVLLVEVLSPTTSGYDYSRKFDLYRTIESFREYLLVFQDEPRADLFRPPGRWLVGLARIHGTRCRGPHSVAESLLDSGRDLHGCPVHRTGDRPAFGASMISPDHLSSDRISSSTFPAITSSTAHPYGAGSPYSGIASVPS